MNINDSIRKIKGIGKKTEEKFNKMNIFTINDFIHNYPIRYEDRSKIKTFDEVNNAEKSTVLVEIMDVNFKNNYGKKSILKVNVKDQNNNFGEIIYFNQPYLKRVFKENQSFYLFGKIERELMVYKMVHPEYMKKDSKNAEKFLSIKPIYSLTEGLKQWKVYKIYNDFFNNLGLKISDTLHKKIIKRNKLCPLDFAIRNIHFPKDIKSYNISKYRLIFEEFLDMQLGFVFLKNKFHKSKGIKFEEQKEIEKFIKSLPFKLTNSQNEVVEDVIKDMKRKTRMNRIIQGDVGSGKTVVGIIAIYFAVLNGYQGAFMAPTEILAEQHYENFIKFFNDTEVNIKLLTSSSNNKEKIYENLSNGFIDVIIGTHALLQDEVKFNKLGLVITDEQHRFGVRQRDKLSEKNDISPDVLVMSATPIPRTLSMTIYGDLDVSTIDEMPSGRKDVDTHYVSDKKRGRMYQFIKKHLNKGRQAYMVAPLVEDSDELDLLSVKTLYEYLKNKVFQNFNVEYIHGKIKNDEKENIMRAFSKGNIDLLISTTVIEVGIDVANANIMVIENVERFGLSQLHQLRGRVGRGEHKSYCFLLGQNLGEIAKKRVEIMLKTNDGFEIAEKDLELRGPGEIFGLKQHGIPEFKIADIIKNKEILFEAQQEVGKLIEVYNNGEKTEIIKFIEKKSEQILKNYSSS